MQARFRRLDRIDAPDLWNEAVGRAAELELAPRRSFNPGIALIAVALLLAALAGTIVVGSWLNRQDPLPVRVEYDNGWLTAQDGCGGVVGIDATTFEPRTLVEGATTCDPADWPPHEGVAWSSDGRRMAYLAASASAQDGSTDPGAIWVYDVDSDQTRQVGECPSFCSAIDISPDGSLVATIGAGGLTILETEGGALHNLDLFGIGSTPRFSPDGRQLVFTVSGGQTGVHVVDVADVIEGIDPGPTLVHRIVAALNPTWSPDGEWIAFEIESAVRADPDSAASPMDPPTMTTTLWVVRPDGSSGQQLTSVPDGELYAAPTWSADSTSIAFFSLGRTGRVALWTVGIGDGQATPIYESPSRVDGVRSPAWSPDGAWIAFGLNLPGRPDDSGIVLVRPDGSDARRASPLSQHPVWQPIPAD